MVQQLSIKEFGAVSFADKLAGSEAFKGLFREGMALVEKTAAYLDGPGREEAKTLPRMAALAYAAESMRLTTRLMQLASWLLLQRAVNEGELTQAEASVEKNKVRLVEQQVASSSEMLAKLPANLGELIDMSLRLQARIIHLDRAIYRPFECNEAAMPAPRQVESQIERLKAAFQTR
jgi:regulator of CtrA degradation